MGLTHVARRRGLRRSSTKLLGAALAFGALAAVVAGTSASCSQTPVNIPVRTFDQPQNIDVVCIQINDANGNALPVDQLTPLPQNECSPVPNGANGALLPNHLYAVVTQVTRGELGVVDLTGGWVIDEDKSTPGTNFIPVGANPTDVKVAPDATFTFVSSADPNKPAIYAIDNRRLLGDGAGVSATGGALPGPLRLTDLMACALPQPPQALAVATRTSPPPGASPFVLMALLRTWSGSPAKVVAIDPTPMTGGKGTPGTLPACSVLGATELSTALPGSWQPGPTWPDGVPYADGGIDVEVPSLGPSCGAADASPAGPADAGSTGTGAMDAGDGGLPLSLGPVDAPRPTSIALRDDVHVLYVADAAVPVIHVIDVSDPTAPREMPPLLATSVAEPSRQVAVGAIAISPPTRDYKRYLYAVDSGNGTLMVFDVTDPATSPRTPLRRPHAELNPFQDPDRILFSAPVATVAFVVHDWPAPSQGMQPPVNQYTGVLCNPNPNAFTDAGVQSIGALYRADQAGQIQAGGTPEGFPNRLRGVFGFATLANGNVVAIDVDDWDAPCRRPDPMASGSITGVLDVPQQPPTGPTDLDPYHAPVVFNPNIGTAGVTEEAFFPVSAPNRLRSNFLLSNDPTSGVHVPNLLGLPQLFDVNGAPVAITGASATTKPLILPTALPPDFADPSYWLDPTAADPSQRNPTSDKLASSASQTAGTFLPDTPDTSPPAVRISFDDPTAHIDQDWTVTYEGALPTVSGIAADMKPADPGYQSLILSAPNAGFCARGIEDEAIGQARARVALDVLKDPNNHLATSGVTDAMVNPSPAPLDQWTSDYVEIADDLVPEGDPYWSVPTKDGQGQPLNDCWDGSLADDSDPNVANNRFTACQAVFDMSWDADTHLARDFPIVQAYDDRLVVTRFAWDPSTPEQTTNRVVVPHPDPSNAPFLRFATCCFHRQATFKVRTGGEWVANGTNNIGLLHQVVPDASGRCVLSCDPDYALLDARAFDVPWSNPANPKGFCAPPQGPSDLSLLDRDSPLAMRNPMFSFIVWSGCGTGAKGDHTLTPRDYQWRFSMRGGFNPVSISLTQANTGSSFVSPQSMLFIGSLGQLAVVDGAQQGLVLIDLNSLTFAHSPYF